MKVVHIYKGNKWEGAAMHIAAWLRKAKGLEKSGEIEAAIAEYLHINKMYPLRQEPYDRLMILYRKTKEYSREAGIISVAIHRFKNQYSVPSATFNKKVLQLSKSLSRSLGLTDKKGALLYDPGPIGRWTKRKKVLEKILDGKTKRK